MKARVWVLDHEQEALDVYLRVLGFRFDLQRYHSADEVADAIAVAPKKPELVVVDGSLKPSALSPIPCIVASECDDLDMIRDCFRDGAFDFIRKPLVASELIARVDRYFAKTNSNTSGVAKSDLSLDNTSLTLKRENFCPVTLTAKEFQIVSLLTSTREQKLHKQEIKRRIWGEVRVIPKTLDVHLANLRKKITAAGLDICSTVDGECSLIAR